MDQKASFKLRHCRYSSFSAFKPSTGMKAARPDVRRAVLRFRARGTIKSKAGAFDASITDHGN
jgi:hypothetical protein